MDDASPPAAVAAVLAGYPPEERALVVAMRRLILDAAAGDARIGPLTETLKWGEPAYLPEATRSGTTIRLGLSRPSRRAAMFLNCRTTLVATIREFHGDRLACRGDREIALPRDIAAEAEALRHAATLALTYHLRRR